MLRRSLLLPALVLGALVIPQTAEAYTYESRVAAGCHERLAAAALRSARTTFPIAPVAPATRNDRALMDDLPFDVPADLDDLAGVSLLIGVRDNDLHGRGPIEIDAIARVHGDPSLQREHCLRGPEQDEPDGTKRALEQCKEFIREKVRAALDGIDDPQRRVDLDVTLALRGRVTASLPVFWIEIGRALHTLEDGFSHTFRSPDRTKVRVTANWTEQVEDKRVEERDGPAHRAEMDECDGLDPYRAKSFADADKASRELLHAVLDPRNATREQKLAAVDRTLDAWLSYEPGCTAKDQWCGAPENQYKVEASACAIAPGRTGSALILGVLGIAGAALLARRRRALAALALVALPSMARAQETEPPPPPPVQQPDPTPASTDPPAPAYAPEVPAAEPKPQGQPTHEEKQAEKKDAEHRSRFALYGATSGSLSNESLNGQLGARVRLSERWMVGLDGELNGWFGVNSGRFAAGAFNGYGTVIFRTPLRFADFNLRSTANAGVSVLLVDLYGAPSGSTGIFLGLTPLGLEWKLSSHVFIVLDAIGIALPIPQLKGAPFAYPQYRAAIGVELAL